MDDPKLLTAFPKPPPGPLSAGSAPKSASSARPSDFGFIEVGLNSEDYPDSPSVYGDPLGVDSNNAFAASTPTSPHQAYNGEFRLVLDDPSRTYSPSDTITGYVVGWHTTAHVHIILEACAITYMREAKMQYKDRAPLLYERVQLKPTNNNVIPRFSITIPERTARGLEELDKHAPSDHAFGRYWTSEWPAQEPYENQAEHPLPPSMTLPLRNLQASGWGHVSYKLIAVRFEPDNAAGKLTSNANYQMPLRFTTLRLPPTKIQELLGEAHDNVSDLFIQTAQLSKQRALSFREHLRDALNASTPTFYFRSCTSIPRLSTPGSDIKITFTVFILPPPPGHLYNFPVPNIAITRLAFQLRSYTGLRVKRLAPDDQKLPKTFTFKESVLQTRQIPAGATFIPKSGAFDGQSCVATVTLPDNVLPSFKTYNIWRSYRLKCEVTFGIAGREVSAKTKSDLNIVARSTRRAVEVQDNRGEIERGNDSASLQMAEAIVSTGLRLL